MAGYVTNIEQDTLENEDYRRVLFTGKNTQLVLMTLQPGDEIGLVIARQLAEDRRDLHAADPRDRLSHRLRHGARAA